MTKNITTNSNRHFALFQSHIDLAHHWWQAILNRGDTAVDATAGNGHDALFLARQILTSTAGTLYAIDIQEKALEATKTRLETEFPEGAHRVKYLLGSHADFPEEFKDLNIKLFVYNLGYLPGSDKSLVTKTSSTLTSIDKACGLTTPGGLISITCYPGHPEGAIEEQALLEWASRLDKADWSVCHHRWVNRKTAPSLLLLQKNG